MHWFPVTLLCALSLATADALTKRLFPDFRGVELLLVRFFVPGLLLAPAVIVNGVPSASPVFWAWMTGLVPLELIAMWLYMRAIRDAPLHLTLPYLSFTPVFNVLTGWLVLGERVSSAGFGGILLVVVGTYVLNLRHLSGRGARDWMAPLGAALRERGSRLMLAVAAIYSVTSVGSKAAMGYTTPTQFGPFYFAVIGAASLVVLSVVQPRALRALGRRSGWQLVVGVLMAVMVVTHFIAMAKVEVAYMVTVKRLSLPFGIVYGALLFGERGLPRNLLASSLMVAGVALILVRG